MPFVQKMHIYSMTNKICQGYSLRECDIRPSGTHVPTFWGDMLLLNMVAAASYKTFGTYVFHLHTVMSQTWSQYVQPWEPQISNYWDNEVKTVVKTLDYMTAWTTWHEPNVNYLLLHCYLPCQAKSVLPPNHGCCIHQDVCLTYIHAHAVEITAKYKSQWPYS